ncbi:hypothetical protein BDY24DRAFT_388727 [Mrakia frigida]|uniref:uncharacterized protein n=1 Tax=Mrakia frigida TaxID=29902 RepID=UPI003FCC1C2F
MFTKILSSIHEFDEWTEENPSRRKGNKRLRAHFVLLRLSDLRILVEMQFPSNPHETLNQS